MFKVKSKLTLPKKTEEQKLDEYLASLPENTSQPLKQLWQHPESMDKTDLFLRNYIVDKKWMSSKHQAIDQADQQMIDEEDEQRSLEMDEYEAKYNFRFEEPGANTITQFPRTIPESMRTKPETRK